MKYILQDGRTASHLEAWASTADIIRAGFFFWNSGTAIQMSQSGLLATLLYQSIQQLLQVDCGIDIVRAIFPDRWEKFDAFGGGKEEFNWLEMQRAFTHMISNDNLRFFFVIDGLDEFEGKSKVLIDFILRVSGRENVKVCVASRPWLAFEDAFQRFCHLSLEDLTRGDISNYVTDKVSADLHFCRLKKREPEKAESLISNIANKAEGVSGFQIPTPSCSILPSQLETGCAP